MPAMFELEKHETFPFMLQMIEAVCLLLGDFFFTDFASAKKYFHALTVNGSKSHFLSDPVRLPPWAILANDRGDADLGSQDGWETEVRSRR